MAAKNIFKMSHRLELPQEAQPVRIVFAETNFTFFYFFLNPCVITTYLGRILHHPVFRGKSHRLLTREHAVITKQRLSKGFTDSL